MLALLYPYSVHVIFTPIAKAVENGPPCGLQCLGHHIVTIERNGRRSKTTHVVAVVHTSGSPRPKTQSFQRLVFRSPATQLLNVSGALVYHFRVDARYLAHVSSPALEYIPNSNPCA